MEGRRRVQLLCTLVFIVFVLLLFAGIQLSLSFSGLTTDSGFEPSTNSRLLVKRSAADPSELRSPRRQWKVVFIPKTRRSAPLKKEEEEGPKKGSKRRLPKALIIGVKKGGTRALLEFLRLHPDVKAVGPEIHFFDRHYDKGVDWYKLQMPVTLGNQLTMEKTPSYFVTRTAPARVRRTLSRDVKLLVVLRDPVTRAISDYAQTASKRPEVKTFDDLVFANFTTGLVDTSWNAVRIGTYCRHLQRWLRYFPLKQFHFVSGDGLISNPAGEMAAVEKFLGLEPHISPSHFFFNETKGFPCVRRPLHRGNRPHCLGKTKGRLHPYVSDSTLEIMRNFYRPFNDKLYKMVGIDFGWPR